MSRKMAAKRFLTGSSLCSMELFALILVLSLSACIADNGPNTRYKSHWTNSPEFKSFYEENRENVPREYNRVHDSSPSMDFDGVTFEEYSVNPDYDPMQPYARDVSARSTKTKFQGICPSIRLRKPLSNDEFEYRPSYIEETFCVHPFIPGHTYDKTRNKICNESRFACIQRNLTVFISRRPTQSECWESEVMNISVACECMWPYHELGDINHRH